MKTKNVYTCLAILIMTIGFFPAGNSQTADFHYFQYKGQDASFEQAINNRHQYFNPVLSGFYPDPSVCRKDSDYYLVTSTFSYYPGVPLFHSTDLVNWVQIGHVLNRPSQLQLKAGIRLSGGIYAPTIRYNKFNDTFYLITTCTDGIGNFIVKTKNPKENNWSDPVPLRFGGIDPDIFFDDDGKAYIVHNDEPAGKPEWDGHRAIWLRQFSVEGDSVFGEKKLIVDGGTDKAKHPVWIEAPHLYKVNGHYYLMCAEGGTADQHSEVIFRADNIFGPYIPWKNNPILTQRDLPENRKNPVTSAGHADLIQTAAGDWYAVFLACRPYEGNYYNTGRETFMLPVTWVDEYPVILRAKEAIPSVVSKANLRPDAKSDKGNFTWKDDFDGEKLGDRYVMLRTPSDDKWWKIANGTLTLRSTRSTIYEPAQPAFTGIRQQHLTFSAQAKMDFSPDNEGDMAGLVCYQREKHNFVFGKTTDGNGTYYLVLKSAGGEINTVAQAEIPLPAVEKAVTLKVEGKRDKYSFFYSFDDGTTWETMAEDVDAKNLSTQAAGGFTGTIIGCYVYNHTAPGSKLPAKETANVFGVDKFVFPVGGADFFPLVENGKPVPVISDANDHKGVLRAVGDLKDDFRKVSGNLPSASGRTALVVGTVGKSAIVDKLIRDGRIDPNELAGKNEKYVIRTVDNPTEDIQRALVIAGSDKRGTIYGIYELSAQMGVSPWYWWADVPVEHREHLYVKPGAYTAGEPAVRYRGIFINDEAPSFQSWCVAKFGGVNSKMYKHMFELILRLKGNFLWPAMWGNAFFDDDPLNGQSADEYGIVIGTSHHEPMGRAHDEWRRYGQGAWNYPKNPDMLQDFWKGGMERMKNYETVVTVGMRGDGDEPMSEDANVTLLQKIVDDQRKIIAKVTRKQAARTPQVWALYKEVQEYYEKGMRVPDDITLLFCDDNWGNVRKLPGLTDKPRKGGYGMYYHVDYVGAPRNYKWLNVTPIQGMWEQLQLTYDYGVDRIWVLNVGDLKPMEYPITFFLDMAWNPKQYTASNLSEHPRRFCAQQFGEEQADEAMRILNLYGKYNGRVTPEMLDRHTYNLETGEWKQVSDEYCKLEAEALRQFVTLPPACRDAYRQLILFPVQAMANLYEMYYAQAMNHKLYGENNPQANTWADKVESAFRRDAALCREYNEEIAGGKWHGMMTQKHIGYTNWNDNFPADRLPEIYRLEASDDTAGNYVFTARDGVVSMEAEHYFSAKNAHECIWTTIPDLGRTLSGVALMPYTKPVAGAELSYKMQLPPDIDEVTVIVAVKSTLAFSDPAGHKYSAGFEGGDVQTVNFNADLNEKPANIYTVFYPTVARRVIEKQVKLRLPATVGETQTLVIKPLDPGIVFEKIVVDLGGYRDSYLMMNESPVKRIKQK
jgi:beta-xylosidase